MKNDPMRMFSQDRARLGPEVDGKEIRSRQLHHAAIKQMMRGAELPQVVRECWKRAEGLNRSYVKLDDLNFVTHTSFRFRLLDSPISVSGLVKSVGAYLDSMPKKLLKHYEEWLYEAQQLEPGCVPILVFKLPALRTNMAILREGTASTDDPGMGRITYSTGQTTYVLESCFTFGRVSARYWD